MNERTRIDIMMNPRSGRGRGERVSGEIREALAGAGLDVRVVTIDAMHELADREADALVVVGGDGTVHAALPHAVKTRVPIYHAPLGTENLFSREFGMSRDPRRVLDAVRTAPARTVDLARCDDRYFAVMCGIGFDANVIESLHRVRRGSISHLSYLRPIWRELASFRLVPITVEVDGEPLVERGTGQLVIANSRQYALRSDPALRAVIDDGLTDVVYLPHATRVGLVGWSLRTRLHTHLRSKRARYATGSTVRVTAHADGASVQIDGEYARSLAADETMEITTVPGALNVLAG